MRGSLLAVLSALFVVFASSVQAAEASADVKGVYLLTDYPALTVRPGSTSTVSLRLQNYATVPERFATLGDLHERIDDDAYSLETLLEWAERDEREGD